MIKKSSSFKKLNLYCNTQQCQFYLPKDFRHFVYMTKSVNIPFYSKYYVRNLGGEI